MNQFSRNFRIQPTLLEFLRSKLGATEKEQVKTLMLLLSIRKVQPKEEGMEIYLSLMSNYSPWQNTIVFP